MQASRQRVVSLLVIAVATVSASALAQSPGGGLRIDTPSVAVEAGAGQLTERFGIRLVNGMSAPYSYDEAGTRYDGGSRSGTGFVLGDWYPTASGFRLSGGLAYPNQRFEGTVRSSGGTMNGSTYSSAQLTSLDGRVRFSKASPYVGVGWGLAPRAGSRLYFSADLGVVYQRPSAALAGTCSSSLAVSTCAFFQSDFRAEEAELRETGDELRLYPVISVGFGVRF